MNDATNSESLKINDLLDQAYKLRINDLSKSLALANQALAISEQNDNRSFKAKCLNQISLYKMISGEYQEAVKDATRAIAYFEEENDELGIANAKYNIAGTLYKTNDFYSGLTHLLDSLPIYKKYNDYHNQSRVLKSMGTIYEYFGDQTRAIEAYEEAIACAKKADDLNLQSNAINPLSGIFLNNGDIPKATELIDLSINMKEQSGDVRGLAFALYGRGKIFTKTKQFKQAEIDFKESIRIHEEMGEKLGKAMSMHKLGVLYKEMKELSKSKTELKRALDFANEYKIILIKFKTNYILHEVEKEQGNLDMALHYLTAYMEEKEAVINSQTYNVISSYEMIAKMQFLERETELQQEKLALTEKKNIELDSFVYRISHDLKGPIASMINLHFLAKRKLKDSPAAAYLDEFKNQAVHINNILDELINLTRIIYENSDNKAQIDFEKLINDAIASFKYLDNYSQVTITADVDKTITYKADWALINTIIQNLIENGIKYARIEDNDPFLKIKVSTIDSQLIITVSDNGVGLSKVQQDKIFHMFYRVNKEITGSGLGLHILQRAVEKLNGKIEVKSQLGSGSTFSIYIPINS